MHPPSILEIVFLCYVLLLLPVGGIRSAAALRRLVPDPDHDPGTALRRQVMISTMVLLLVTLGFSWVTGVARDFDLFGTTTWGWREFVGTGIALAIALVARRLVLVASSSSALREAIRWMPRTPGEKRIAVLLVLLAGIAEEAAYRGVAIDILLETTGQPWLAVVLSSTAFAIAHFAQQWKAMCAVFLFALTMHALVWWTGGLLAAMAVHVVYDLVAGWLGVRLRQRQIANA